MSRMRERRLALGWSQSRLARDAGVTEKAVSRWELRGVEHAEFAVMARVARALGVPMEGLLDGPEGRG